MKKCVAIYYIVCGCMNAPAQSSATVEQYYFTRSARTEALMTPIANFTSSNNWYGEARYNFDELNTFSLYAGKKFSGAGNVSWQATPLVGGLMGQMTGGSVGVNIDIDYRKLFVATQSQYSFSLENNRDKYFFNWSEVGYNATSWLYAGLAVQQTNIFKTIGKLEPGYMVGFSIRNWTIPLYAFNTTGDERYFVLGLNWKWQGKNKKYNNEQLLTAEPNNYPND
ncbi:MAG TPA: hypothetical protein VM101_09620 [Flavitalea sp.]|nr:hypothetical protein [Flavitalea sp.]